MKLKTIDQLETSSKQLVKLHTNLQDLNNEMTGRGIKPAMQGHWVEGVEKLITEILTEREAIFPKGIEHTEFKKVAIAAAMFTSEIKDEIETRFTAGTTRYPLETVETYLSVFMPRKGTIGKIKLTNAEDKPRPAKNAKPRYKWYLIK